MRLYVQSSVLHSRTRHRPYAVNVNGAIALDTPLGCTGTKLSTQLFKRDEEEKTKGGMVTMCVGTGQGGACVFMN